MKQKYIIISRNVNIQNSAKNNMTRKTGESLQGLVDKQLINRNKTKILTNMLELSNKCVSIEKIKLSTILNGDNSNALKKVLAFFMYNCSSIAQADTDYRISIICLHHTLLCLHYLQQ